MHIRRPLLLLFFFTLLFFVPLLGGEQQFDRFSVEQGLSQSTVNAIIEDRYGLMWFGTQDGLNMFDGYAFTVFKHDPADSNSISDNWITSLYQDRDGNIWVGTLEGGLNLYPTRRDRFIHFRYDPGNPTSLSGNNIVAISQDIAGALWVGVWGGGLNRYDGRTNTFTRFQRDAGDDNSLSDNQVYCLLEDTTHTLWVGTWNGLTSVDPSRKRFSRYLIPTSGNESGEKVTGLFQNQDGTLWIATRDHGLMVYDRKNDRILPRTYSAHSPLRGVHIWALSGGTRGTLWIATGGNGLIHLDPASDTTTIYANDPYDPNSLYTNSVLRVFKDSRGLLWIGTEGGGISMLDQQQRRFVQYSHRQLDPHSLSHNVVRCITEGTNGDLWIGTQAGGLNRFDVRTRQFQAYRHHTAGGTLRDDNVFSLYHDKAGSLWVGTASGLDRYDYTTGRFTKVDLAPQIGATRQLANITAITQEKNGALWIGTYGDGLVRYDPHTRAYSLYQKSAHDSSSISGNWILSLFVDKVGELWVGTWGTGVCRLDGKTQTFRRYRNNHNNPRSLANNTVNCIVETRDGILWMGTQGGGLCRFDRNSDGFTSFTEKDGLPNGVIYGIIQDEEGNLWLSTNNGIARFNPTARQSRNFDISDGLQGNEFNGGAFCRTHDGQLFFGGVNGMTAFFPPEIRDNATVPPILLTSFKIFDKPAMLPQSIFATDKVELSYTDNFFSFEFAALEFAIPAKNRYLYMMEGFDRDWINAGTRRYASYTHLDPGDYTFRVRASNNDGVWNMNGAAVQIHIVPPLWQTWWFRIISGLGGVIAIGLIIQKRFRKLQVEKIAQQEFSKRLIESQETERKRIAGELHDSIGQNLLVIRNRALLGLKEAGLSTQARDQLDHISSVATQAIDEVREISYDLRPYQLDRLGLTKAITSITSGLATPIQFSVSVDPIDNEVGKDESIHVFRIVQEGINNILKHAEASEVRVVVRTEEKVIRIVLSDNGKGMPPGLTADGQRGFGLVGITERAKVLNGTVTIDSVQGKGTTLTVAIPRVER